MSVTQVLDSNTCVLLDNMCECTALENQRLNLNGLKYACDFDANATQHTPGQHQWGAHLKARLLAA